MSETLSPYYDLSTKDNVIVAGDLKSVPKDYEDVIKYAQEVEAEGIIAIGDGIDHSFRNNPNKTLTDKQNAATVMALKHDSPVPFLDLAGDDDLTFAAALTETADNVAEAKDEDPDYKSWAERWSTNHKLFEVFGIDPLDPDKYSQLAQNPSIQSYLGNLGPSILRVDHRYRDSEGKDIDNRVLMSHGRISGWQSARQSLEEATMVDDVLADAILDDKYVTFDAINSLIGLPHISGSHYSGPPESYADAIVHAHSIEQLEPRVKSNRHSRDFNLARREGGPIAVLNLRNLEIVELKEEHHSTLPKYPVRLPSRAA